jgi:hypothetical protein
VDCCMRTVADPFVSGLGVDVDAARPRGRAEGWYLLALVVDAVLATVDAVRIVELASGGNSMLRWGVRAFGGGTGE